MFSQCEQLNVDLYYWNMTQVPLGDKTQQNAKVQNMFLDTFRMPCFTLPWKCGQTTTEELDGNFEFLNCYYTKGESSEFPAKNCSPDRPKPDPVRPPDETPPNITCTLNKEDVTIGDILVADASAFIFTGLAENGTLVVYDGPQATDIINYEWKNSRNTVLQDGGSGPTNSYSINGDSELNNDEPITVTGELLFFNDIHRSDRK